MLPAAREVGARGVGHARRLLAHYVERVSRRRRVALKKIKKTGPQLPPCGPRVLPGSDTEHGQIRR